MVKTYATALIYVHTRTKKGINWMKPCLLIAWPLH